MTPSNAQAKDLVVLTADKNTQFALRGIFSRFHALGIRQVQPDYYIHPGHDPGVYCGGHDFLHPFIKTHAHALVFMDREGSGQDQSERTELEEQIETRLRTSGWESRARAVVIDPELDIWVWSDSPHVDSVLGWTEEEPALRIWLRQEGWLDEEQIKPSRPKEALDAALKKVRLSRSSAIYEALAKKVSLARCVDPAFVKMRAVLQQWFPQ
jgi:hypothetical protein